MGPLKGFTAVSGPTETGKADLLDAFSFVLAGGFGSIDLISKGQAAASVKLSLIYEKGECLEFSRYVSKDRDVFSIDGDIVDVDHYKRKLEHLGITHRNIIYKADLENVTSGNPKLIFDKIIGSHTNIHSSIMLEVAEAKVLRAKANYDIINAQLEELKLQAEKANEVESSDLASVKMAYYIAKIREINHHLDYQKSLINGHPCSLSSWTPNNGEDMDNLSLQIELGKDKIYEKELALINMSRKKVCIDAMCELEPKVQSELGKDQPTDVMLEQTSEGVIEDRFAKNQVALKAYNTELDHVKQVKMKLEKYFQECKEKYESKINAIEEIDNALPELKAVPVDDKLHSIVTGLIAIVAEYGTREAFMQYLEQQLSTSTCIPLKSDIINFTTGNIDVCMMASEMHSTFVRNIGVGPSSPGSFSCESEGVRNKELVEADMYLAKMRELKIKIRQLSGRAEWLNVKITKAKKAKVTSFKNLMEKISNELNQQKLNVMVQYLGNIEKKLAANQILDDSFMTSKKQTVSSRKNVAAYDNKLKESEPILQQEIEKASEAEKNLADDIKKGKGEMQLLEKQLQRLKSTANSNHLLEKDLQKILKNTEYARDSRDGYMELSALEGISLPYVDDAQFSENIDADYTRAEELMISAKISEKFPISKRISIFELLLKAAGAELESAKKEKETISEQFKAAKIKRQEIYKEANKHVSEQIDANYKKVTTNDGIAFVEMFDKYELLSHIKYTAKPPQRTHICDMDQLSFVEKIVAGLAFLFSVQSFSQQALLILDMVDAPLDDETAAKIGVYISKWCEDKKFNYIVFSRKTGFYNKASTFVSVFRDSKKKDPNAFRIYTMSYKNTENTATY